MNTALELRVDTILDTLPPYYLTSKAIRDILTAYVGELADVDASNDDLINQLYVPTATWGLVYWENDYGLTPSQGANYETRRADVMAKMLGQGTFTKRSAKSLANVYSQAKTAEFIPRPGDDAFKTRHDVDDLTDYASLVASFEEMKPAHLEHVIGLLIRRLIGPNMVTTERLKDTKGEAYDFAYTKRERLKDQANIISISQFMPPTSEGLYLNGSWKLDGAVNLDGVNHYGIMLYVRQAHTLRVRSYNDGVLIADDTY